MTSYLNIFSRWTANATPQSRPIRNTVPNSAGGYAFALDDWARLDRFVILGSEGGSYYAGERALTRDNAQAALRAIAADGARAVSRIVAISEAGGAPKNDSALLALALAASADDLATRRAALAALPRVARTGTHLFQFAEFVQGSRGWGRALRRAVGDWYLSQPVDRLAYQLVQYRQRGGWSHRDLLRLAHPETGDAVRAALLDWACRGTVSDLLPSLVRAAVSLVRATDGAAAAALIRAADLPREAVPTPLLNDVAVWEALLQHMPLTALLRSLAKLTAVGVVHPFSNSLPMVVSALADGERIARARLHPLAILLALRTYAQGFGDRGALRWEPVQPVIDALNAAFYAAFRAVEPCGKRLLLALDVSGSVDEDSEIGRRYIAAMQLAGRYSYAGREWVVERVRKIIGGAVTDMVHNHHNYAWRETHGGRDLWVVRKGATPAWPGQRGFVGGSMGDDAVIIEGVDSAKAKAPLHSTVHGAGRLFGRKAAKRTFTRAQMDAWLRERGVKLAGGDLDESPMAYRRLPEVLAQHAGTIRVVHTLRPFAVAMAGEGEFDPFKD